MYLFYRRPLALFCLFFAATSIGGCLLDSSLTLKIGVTLLGVIAVLGVFCVLSKTQRARLLSILFCVAFSALALFNTYYRVDRTLNAVQPLASKDIAAELTVESVVSKTSFSSSYEVSLVVDGVTIHGQLDCEYTTPYAVGDVLKATVTAEDVHNTPYSDYYLSKGYSILLRSEENDISLVAQEEPGIRYQLETFNNSLASVFKEKIGGDAGDLFSAIFLGNRNELESSVLTDFRRAGVSHILAISGMHLSILVFILEKALGFLGTRKSIRCILILLLAFFYLALTGFSLSTVRSFIMTVFVYAAFLTSNDNDSITSLFFSVFLILAASPFSVWDIGLWMSFLAVLGILVSEHFTNKLKIWLHNTRLRPRSERILYLLFSSVFVSLFANIFVAVPLCIAFDEFSLLSMFSTIIMSPLLSVLLFFAPLLILASVVTLFFFLATPIAYLCRILGNAAISVVSFLSEQENITVSLRYPFVPYIIFPAAVLLFILLFVPLKKKRWILIAPLLAAALFAGQLAFYNHANQDLLTVDYLATGESEMIILTTTKDTVICDISTGANSHLENALSVTVERYQTDVSALVLTHYHTRHVNSLRKYSGAYIIRNLYLPYPQNEDEFFTMYALIDVAKKSNIRVVLFDRDDVFEPAPSIVINLTSPVYLKRSTHPAFALSIATSNDNVIYVSESAHESESLFSWINEQLNSTAYVILGTHGPITKTEFLYNIPDSVDTVFVDNQTVLQYMDPASVSNKTVVFGSNRITLRLENKKQ